jgi:hypothetical protein
MTAGSPARTARIAGVFYALTFLTGTLAFVFRGKLGLAFGLVAGACYVGVTLLFYVLFRPVNEGLSGVAAAISLAGCVIGPLSRFFPALSHIHPFVFFGFYCLLIGYLIFRSTFLPHFLGALMAVAGLGWLTFFSPELARSLSPYNFAPGIFGEACLTVWLLLKRVDVPRGKQRASAGARS